EEDDRVSSTKQQEPDNRFADSRSGKPDQPQNIATAQRQPINTTAMPAVAALGNDRYSVYIPSIPPMWPPPLVQQIKRARDNERDRDSSSNEEEEQVPEHSAVQTGAGSSQGSISKQSHHHSNSTKTLLPH